MTTTSTITTTKTLAELIAEAKAVKALKETKQTKQQEQEATRAFEIEKRPWPDEKKLIEPEEKTETDLVFITEAPPPKPEIVFHAPHSYPIPDPSLFLAIYTPFLLNPEGFNLAEFRDYKKWLLAPSLYVLNTFKSTNTDRLFELFMLHRPPVSILGLKRLADLLWDIDLTVPQEFEEDFVRIIQRKIDLDNSAEKGDNALCPSSNPIQ